MAETKRAVERPLSPHLGIYRMQIKMMMSIVHRITGGALYFGTLLLAAWLVVRGHGRAAFATVNALFGHPLGKLVLFGYTWALLHHMLGGMRHLLWDTGRGLQIWSVDILGWLTILGSLSLTLACCGRSGFRSGEGCDMSLRTPLAKVRGLGSAKEGTDHFWKQRLTAVANIFLVVLPDLAAGEARRRRPRHRQARAGQAAERHPAAAAGAVRRHAHAARYADHHRGLCAFRRAQGGRRSC